MTLQRQTFVDSRGNIYSRRKKEAVRLLSEIMNQAIIFNCSEIITYLDTKLEVREL